MYHSYHVPYVSYITNVCVSNLPQKCDELFCAFVSCVSYVSCTICTTYNKGMFCQICPKNVTNCFAALSHVYHMYHVPYVPYLTSVGVSNLPQKCDELFCVFVSCVSYVSSTICIIHNKCMFLKICPKNVTNCFALAALHALSTIVCTGSNLARQIQQSLGSG